MPVNGPNYSRRSEDLKKLASLAESMSGLGQQGRIVVSNGSFVGGSPVAWRRAPDNREAQLKFKQILTENYGSNTANRVAHELGLDTFYVRGKHLSPADVIKAIQKAEACETESDERYWQAALGMTVKSPSFAQTLRTWVEARVQQLSTVPMDQRAAVVDAVMDSPELKKVLATGGIVDRAFINTFLPVAYTEIAHAGAPRGDTHIENYYQTSCADKATKAALVRHLVLTCGVTGIIAEKTLQHPSLQGNPLLTVDHIEVLENYARELAVALSSEFIDQSSNKVKALGSDNAKIEAEVVLLKEEGRPSAYSDKARESIESGKAYGLSAYDRPEYTIHKSGICYDAHGITRIGDKYVYVRNKRKGVEPGFEARKAFQQKDYHKVFNQPNHKYYQAADIFLRTAIQQPNSPIHSRFLQAQSEGILPRPDDYLVSMLKDPDSAVSRYAADLRASGAIPLMNGGELDSDALNTLLLDHFKDEAHAWCVDQSLPFLREEFVTEIIEHITDTFPMFTKLHFVKLDYKESDMHKDLVRIPKEKSKGVLHRQFTAQTRREANESASQEAIANDLLRLMGVYSQKLKIIRSWYADGTPKLLLDGTFMKGPNGENFEDFAGCIVDGYLVPRELAEKYKAGTLTVAERINTDQSIEDLGKFLIFMLGLADRDAIGSRGDNKGRCGNTFAGIDPGHSLEVGEDSRFATNLMSFKNVHSDFSFEQPGKLGDKLSKGYKNFSVFQDRPYLEKMKGIESWLALRESGDDLALFDAYLETFTGVDHSGEYHPELDFREKIASMRDAYVARRDYILDDVFADRVPFLSNDRQPYGKPALEVVDALEKLTSVTSMASPNGVVSLEHPQVLSRVRWDMAEVGDRVTFVTKNGAEAEAKIAAFNLENPLPPGVVLKKSPNGALALIVPKDQVIALSQCLNEQAIIQHKHPQ